MRRWDRLLDAYIVSVNLTTPYPACQCAVSVVAFSNRGSRDEATDTGGMAGAF